MARPALVERALADRNNLKASVTAVLVILVGEAIGLLASIGFSFLESRLKVCADGGIAVDAADAFPFSDAVNLIGHGLASSSMRRRSAEQRASGEPLGVFEKKAAQGLDALSRRVFFG
jgi:hypothetical protein